MSLVRIVLAFFPTILPVVAQSSWVARYASFGLYGAAQAVAVDASGNVFAAGTLEPSGDTCVYKMDAQGRALGNICYTLGGPSVQAAAVDPEGNLVLAGTTAPQYLPLVSPLISNTDPRAGFVMKLDSQLTKILFSTLLGGTEPGPYGPGLTGIGTFLTALALDSAGNIYVGGYTLDANYPVTPGAYQTTSPTSKHGVSYLTAISSAGDRILYSTFVMGSSNGEFAPSVTQLAVDKTGAVVMAGTAAGQLPVTPGAIGPTCRCPDGEQFSFLAKFALGGSELRWATYVNSASVTALALDASGNVVIGGTAGTGFSATSGALQTANPGANLQPGNTEYDPAAGFVAKLDSSAQHYIFATYLGGNNFEEMLATNDLMAGTNGVTGLSVDPQGTIWVTGGSQPSELPLPGSIPLLGSTYLIGLTSDGSAITSAATAPEGAAGQGIAISPLGAMALGKSGTVLVPVSGQGPSLIGIANAAGQSAIGSVAPNELVSFYGAGIGPATAVSGLVVNGALTTSLGGVQVMFDGVAAPLLYAGPNQINAVVPSDVNGKDSTSVEIFTAGRTIAGVTLAVVSAAPEVFVSPPPGVAAAALNQDGTPNSAANPAPVGSVVSVWGTGGGASNNPNADGTINGDTTYPLQFPVNVEQLGIVLQYSGDAPGMVKGMFQVNFQISALAAKEANGGALQLFLQVGPALSDPFTIYVE
jgi:uncharacterized protein (TIGR03437 family)